MLGMMTLSCETPTDPGGPRVIALAEKHDAAEAEGREAALLDAIRAGSWAWSRVEDLIAAGHDEETVDALVERGLLDRWDLPEEPPGPHVPPSGKCITFSALAVERLGVMVLEEGYTERPRWAWPSEIPRYVQTWRQLYSIEFPEMIVDSAPRPDEELLMAERWDQERNIAVVEAVRLFEGEKAGASEPDRDGLRGGIGAGPGESGATIVVDPRLGKGGARAKGKVKGKSGKRRKAS